MQLTLQFQSLSYPHVVTELLTLQVKYCMREGTIRPLALIQLKSDINLPNVVSNVGIFSEKLKNGPCQNKDRQEGISCHHREVLHEAHPRLRHQQEDHRGSGTHALKASPQQGSIPLESYFLKL